MARDAHGPFDGFRRHPRLDQPLQKTENQGGVNGVSLQRGLGCVGEAQTALNHFVVRVHPHADPPGVADLLRLVENGADFENLRPAVPPYFEPARLASDLLNQLGDVLDAGGLLSVDRKQVVAA